MNIHARNITLVFGWLLLTCSCSNDKTIIENIKISFPGNNVLSAQLEVHTTESRDAYLRYGIVGQENGSIISQSLRRAKDHRFLLKGLKPGHHYVFNVVTSKGNDEEISRDYFFNTIGYPGGVKDTFRVACADTSVLPDVFKKGCVMIHRREAPGIVLLLNAEGNVVWHHQAKEEGFKVVNFTQNGTLLCLMGTKVYETSYGSALLELSMAGDTLLYLKKGQNDFQQTIHHEVLLNPKNEIVTLCVEDRVMDLRSRGGTAKDTIRGDGILVLDRKGRQIWKWTVFDALDPLADEQIVHHKKDWMHANSVSFDKDGHYLISFYNNGQIWKVNAQTGKVIWKLGKGGDFNLPGRALFDQAHAVHITTQGWMLFFDNGTRNRISRTLAFALDEKVKKAELVLDTWLPPQLFSDRMGSSFRVGDTTLLQCASKQKTVALTSFRGNILWQLVSSGVVSYRAQFISREKLSPFLNF